MSSTICVYRTAKWFNSFVRGTFETEKLRKLRGVRAFSTTTKTVIKIMLILTPHAGFVLTLSNVGLGPLGAAPSSAGGGPQPFYAFKCCFSLICRICGNHLPTQPICSFVCPPPAAQPQALNNRWALQKNGGWNSIVVAIWPTSA